jgi:RNA polymerase sigma-70 factor (ECF subfamily)
VYLREGVDEAALVRRCLTGDAEAFEPIVRAYQAPLFNVALRMLGTPEDARDATQTAFVRAYEHLDSYDPAHKFFTWIYRILMNECLNVLRARRPSEPVPDDLASERNRDRLDPIDAEKRRQAIQAAILALPVDYRQVIVLRHFAELSYEEIAATVSIPVKTVKSRLFSARQRLGEQLLGWKAT